MMDPFSAQLPPLRVVPPAMAEPSYYYHQPTMLGFLPHFAPGPFAQGAIAAPPPVLVPMQTTSVEPAYYYPQAQGAAGEEAATVHHAVPEAQKAQETTAPTPQRRGRPRKTAAAASKPVFKAPKKRATARSNRAASQQAATSATNDLATIVGQALVQKPEQAASVAAASTSDAAQAAPCRNPTPPLCQEQWRPQSTCSSSLGAGGQAAAVVAGQQEVTLPYAYAETSAAGVRFRPTDEDLIFFLRLKHAGREIPVGFFKDFDVYQASPEASKAACEVVDGDGCWYAFSPRDRKYKNGGRPQRSVVEADGQQLGYWKSNTKLAQVLTSGEDEGKKVVTGNVTSLTFHVGHQPHGRQTPWKMKEYAIPDNEHAPDGSAMRLNDWVVCKLFYKERVISARKKKNQSGEDGKNVDQAGGEQGTQMVSTDVQTHGDFEQDLCVVDYPGYDDAFA
ncbi:hypothetical protein PVAP13_9NG061173 [Panicum virgatum]|uniref:NAC domain-containing protein n=1 Tax=Panicum virgatum TaxID=38727 RepID=A0A8T0MBJ3_PANVG|nr:hypothetical protein PVAP13_9NG061173 [Panicum virgatum]